MAHARAHPSFGKESWFKLRFHLFVLAATARSLREATDKMVSSRYGIRA
jgi:hypothetical protein